MTISSGDTSVTSHMIKSFQAPPFNTFLPSTVVTSDGTTQTFSEDQITSLTKLSTTTKITTTMTTSQPDLSILVSKKNRKLNVASWRVTIMLGGCRTVVQRRLCGGGAAGGHCWYRW